MTGGLSDADVEAAQALADMATISILQQRAVNEERASLEQLQETLTSRIVIEQAKGALSGRAGIDIAEAFDGLRRYARDHSERLSLVAQALLDGTLDAAGLAAACDRSQRPASS